MSFIDTIGFIGVAMILLAYFLNLKNILNTDSLIYILLNLFGAMLACLASILMKYLPFVLLEATWMMVSIDAFIRYLNKKKYRKKDFVE